MHILIIDNDTEYVKFNFYIGNHKFASSSKIHFSDLTLTLPYVSFNNIFEKKIHSVITSAIVVLSC